MRKIFAFVFIFMMASSVQAAEVSLFEQANAKYRAGDFKTAAQLYEKIVNTKQATAATYYNLGNATLRLGNKGRALLFYRRAQAVTPRDTDIDWNIHILKAALPDRTDEDAPNVLNLWLRKALSYFTLNETALIFFSFLAVLFIFSLLGFISSVVRSRLGFLNALVLIGLVISTVFFYLKWQDAQEPGLVVLDREVFARNGPSLDESKAFLLHEGAEGKVADESKDWYYVALANKNAGWVPKDSCEVV